jgi:hypothetical protein
MQWMMLDVVCQRLAIARDRLVLPLSRVAKSITLCSAWQAFGYARASDFTREQLKRSSRWLRELAALDEALRRLPGLSGALCGDDGQPAIGRVAASLIGRIATPESLAAWIDVARLNTVRALRAEISRARESRSAWPMRAHDVADADRCTLARNDANDTSASGERCEGHGTPAPDHGAPEAECNASEPGVQNDPELQDELRAGVTVSVPRPVFTAFQETLDLHRAVVGRESRVTEFVDALSAESSNACVPADGVDVRPLSRGPKLREDEERLARLTQHWKHLDTVTSVVDEGSVAVESRVTDIRTQAAPLGDALALIEQLEGLTANAGHGDPSELLVQLDALIGLEEQIEIQLGQLLASISENHGWRQLRFKGVGHYGTERLGLSRTTAEDRAGLARLLRDRPRVRRAYEQGRLGLEAALLVCRVLARSRVTARLESAWVERAAHVTIKRLRDEVRIAIRSQMLGPGSERLASPDVPAPLDLSTVSLGSAQAAATQSPVPRGAELDASESAFPVDDRAWHDSLQRAPGDGRQRLVRLGIMALENPIPDVFLRLRLPDDVAEQFVGTLEVRRRQLAAQAEHDTWEEDWNEAPWEGVLPASALGLGDDDAAEARRPSWVVARVFASRGRRLPTWVALLAMLEDYVHTWDDPIGAPARASAAVYIRDGWRCTAPGCTSRQNLEDHHIVYRARGGGNDIANRTCICRFHHQRGEHGGLASCRGRAPLDIIWRLGRRDLARWYRNERLLAPVRSSSSNPAKPGASLSSSWNQRICS